MRKTSRSVFVIAVLATGLLWLSAGIANASIIAGSSYSADIGPFASAPWNDAGGDPTAPGGVSWAASELFDGTIETSGNGNVVGWYEALSGAPTLTFDLGGLYDLSTINVWRRVGNGTVTDLTISLSTDDVTYSTPVAYTPATWSANEASIDVSSSPAAQYARVKLGPDAVSGGWLMLTEASFDGTAVPEPASLAVMAIAGLGLLLRRRRMG